MQGTFGQVEFVPLPPRFAARVRWGSVVVGSSMIAGMVLLFGLTTFLQGIVHGHAFPDTLLGKAAAVLPPLGVLAIAVLVLSTRRCLRGDYLVVASAASARHALLFTYLLTLVLILGSFAVPIVFRVWRDTPDLRAPDLLTVFTTLAFATTGFLAGMFYVRPSVQTLRKFSDHPIW
ncbi:hypothetical protein H4696_007485 [Amycolatopsis lexingtonensis]|uniref:Tripartite tricarboxylate transporter TctB family protein n=1 Tax=Amycolatopsis lexingtonensis TaxID=218822 RepID=A0ABR9IB15_9PSEU|nr:hypothetical protein [Amycolatopsis lexingtonensis]MBE1500385.1 hypothetical protein [Amycolatopsis lexingtonensis]